MRGVVALPISTKLRMPSLDPREQDRVGEASRSRGKQPRSPAKAPNVGLSVVRMWESKDSQEVGSEAAIL